MKGFKLKRDAGFSLLELMVVVAIIGVLAAVAVPRFNIFRARARQAEAKNNLGVIFTLQEAFKIDKEKYYDGAATWGGAAMNTDATSQGYRTAGSSPICEANKLGYRLANCDAARYRYWVAGATENVFLVVAAAHSDSTAKRIFPGCAGKDAAGGDLSVDVSGSPSATALKCFTSTAIDATVKNGDGFCLDHNRKLDNFKDIVIAPECDN